MNISYRHLRAFIEVAHSTTFAEAAAKLYLTQPALSSSIKKMESELGGRLFKRNTRNVSLTPEGEKEKTKENQQAKNCSFFYSKILLLSLVWEF